MTTESVRKCSNTVCKRSATGQFKRCEQCRINDKNRRAQLIADGLCGRCEVEPAMAGRTSCEACLAYDRDRNNRRRAVHAAAGVCVQCAEHPPRPGKRTCEKCGSAHKIAAEKGLCCRCKSQPATIGRYCMRCKREHIAWEEAQIAAGKCIRCSTAAVTGLLHCEKHRRLDRKRTRERTLRLKAEGKCRICTAPSEGRSRCSDCQLRHTEKMKKRRDELRAKGLCDCCGKRPYMLDYRRCEECQTRKTLNQKVRTPEQVIADRVRVKRAREKFIAAGVCARCGKEPAVEGRKACEECLEVQRMRTAIAAAKRNRAREHAESTKRPKANLEPKMAHRVRFA